MHPLFEHCATKRSLTCTYLQSSTGQGGVVRFGRCYAGVTLGGVGQAALNWPGCCEDIAIGSM